MNARTEWIVRMAELEIDPARIEAYTALLAEEVETSVAKEPGVLMLHAVSVNGNPERIRILEVYASQQDYEAHLQSPHFLKYKTLTGGMVKSLDLVEVDPIVMCAK
ncbi:putative quinol monooxygenase [Pararhizobium sp. A13]|uniref:putative quinol monooxygenase n=1 Tax=Pararhizobium sp. A13 TaxID=3133975 RepID=UPI00324DC2BD